ncbi:MAG: glycoside hydrolase family 38 C-terminal domain-containing protein [Chloroherpetonaceae bacterium]|nr:glycosyl hydrolase-related protein [Chthonomonadaceae bacterium]MDW8206896.1 glycoside hydrolase family 38 C-terminal domain-containing protein [Chloroherpetonaceae bacterium]
MNPETRARIREALCERPASEVDRWIRRAEIQLEFARAFAAALPAEETTGWEVAIQRAVELLDRCDPAGGIEALQQAVLAAEEAMQGIAQKARQYRIHCVGHGHIDMNWMWSWAETVATTHDTLASVLTLMEQYPELTYSQSQASVYALMERYYPELFAQIRERVREGRWEVTAVHWVEGDKNLASGEALCRHLLLTRRYFQQKFGLSPEDVPVDWEPDTFGHAGTVPAFLAQGAVRYYYSCRTGGGFDHPLVGGERPRLFYWQAPNGARVLVNRESTWYNSYVNIGDNIALPLVAFVRETGLHDWLNVYGIGNHGGGPTRTEIEWLRTLQEYPVYPQIVFSTASRYFAVVEQELAQTGRSLPVLDHELNFEFTGCYTSQSAIKRSNRLGENYLLEAETLATLATHLTGARYPSETLREAWTHVLFNQFHDILPGSGVRETREHALALFQEVGAITGSVKRMAGKALAARVNTLALLPDTPRGHRERAHVQAGGHISGMAGAGMGANLTGYSQASTDSGAFRPFLVYNPCAWPRSERVTVALYDTGFDPARIVAVDENGVAHPTLLLDRGYDWGHERLTVAFDAADVPALGYRTYLLCEGSASPPAHPVTLTSGDWIETPFLRFRPDRFRPGLLELIDRRTGARLTDSTAGLSFGAWQYVVERPRGMTSWVLGEIVDPPVMLRVRHCHILGARRNQGNALPLQGDAFGYQIEQMLEVPGTQSTVRLSMMVHGLEPRIDVTAEIDWREIGDPERGIPGLILCFPLGLTGLSCRYEVPFGSVQRTLFGGEEVPALRYAHVAGEARTGTGTPVYAGVTLLQDCKYGHSLLGSQLRLRIVRSSFDPDHAPEVARSTVRYALYLHDTPPDPATLMRLGAAWNHPLMLIPASLQAGTAPPREGFIQVETPGVVLTALKQAEDGNGLILRLVEANGQDAEAVVALAPALAAGLRVAQCVDLMERPVAGSVRWEDSTLRVPVPAHSFVTIKLTA